MVSHDRWRGSGLRIDGQSFFIDEPVERLVMVCVLVKGSESDYRESLRNLAFEGNLMRSSTLSVKAQFGNLSCPFFLRITSTAVAWRLSAYLH